MSEQHNERGTGARAHNTSFTSVPSTMTLPRPGLLALGALVALVVCVAADPCTLLPTYGNAYVGDPKKYVRQSLFSTPISRNLYDRSAQYFYKVTGTF